MSVIYAVKSQEKYLLFCGPVKRLHIAYLRKFLVLLNAYSVESVK